MERPSKESVRAWLYGQIAAKVPPPAPAEIRRQLGWGLVDVKRECAR